MSPASTGSGTAVRVLMIVEQVLVGRTVAAALEGPGLQVSVADFEAPDLADACRRLRPDVVVVDADALAARGWALMLVLRESSNGRVLALSGRADEELAGEALDQGASGFVTLDMSLHELRMAIEEVSRGGSVVSGVPLARLLRGRPSKETTRLVAAHQLTVRELDILARLARGDSTAGIARDLAITPNTARTHIQNVMRKLDVHSRLEAAAFAVRAGLV